MPEEEQKGKEFGCFRMLGEKLKPLLTRRNQRIFFMVTLVMAAVAIVDVIYEIFPLPVSIVVYFLAAVSFFSSLSLWIRAILLFFRMVWFPFTERNRVLRILIKDYRLRTVVMALPGLGMNFVFGVFNGAVGVVSHSAWYWSLASYYLFLCIVRFLSVMYAKSIYIDKREEAAEVREMKVYKTCGMLLSLMSLALLVVVIALVDGTGRKSYPKILTIAIAAYTFYKLVMSVVNVIRARREKSLISVTLRYIGHSEALVALLSLQSALFSAFGKNDYALIPVMNTATGIAVAVAVLLIGIHMTWDGSKRLRLVSQQMEVETDD